MAVSSVDALSNVLNGLHANGTSKTSGSDSVFSDYLSQAIEQAKVSTEDSSAYNSSLLTGELDYLHEAPIAAREAELAISLTVQIRDKLVEAYSEIMRMQV